MTLRLDDPRIAQEIARLVDDRVRYALTYLMPQIRYGIVTAVDAPNRRAAVGLGGAAAPSPGFVYPPYFAPVVGDHVRVVIRGADRYLDAILSGAGGGAAPPWSGREIVLAANHSCANNTWVKPTGYSAGRWQSGGEYPLSSSSLVLPHDGLYLVTAVAEWVAAAGGIRAVGIGTSTVSPSATYHQQRATGAAAPSVVVRGAYLHPATAGETLALWGYQSSGGGLAVVGGLTALAVIYLGPNPAALTLRDAILDRMADRNEVQPMSDERRDFDATTKPTDPTELDPESGKPAEPGQSEDAPGQGGDSPGKSEEAPGQQPDAEPKEADEAPTESSGE